MNIKRSLLCSLFIYIPCLTTSLPQYYCTAANSIYFPHLLNLIGSIHKHNFEQLENIMVFDLGLSSAERDHLKTIQKLSLHDVERIHPDVLTIFKVHATGKTVPGWYAWKPVAIKQALDVVPYVLWIDAGSTVLKRLDPLFEYIEKHGYFLGTIGMDVNIYNVGWGTTKYVVEAFTLDTPENKWILSAPFVMGNIIGASRKAYKQLVRPFYEMVKNIRLFEDDGTTPNGFGTGRHDQTLLSIHAHLNNLKVHVQDETQRVPMILDLDECSSPLYITWNVHSVCAKTHIYSSRNDLRNAVHYHQYIRYCEKST